MVDSELRPRDFWHCAPANDTDEVGGTQGRMVWHGQLALHACLLARARPRTGAWPRPSAALGLGAVYGGKERRRPHGGPRSTTNMSRSTVRRGIARTPRGRRQLPLLLFHLSAFANAKLEKVTTNLKISKYKSCRGAIDLLLSQRATYVLINDLSGNVGRSCSLSTARVTVRNAFNSSFGQFALKIGMSANYEKCVPGNNEQLSYWPILNFYSEIWRTRKKTKSAFMKI
jgi:hypothetical protein